MPPEDTRPEELQTYIRYINLPLHTQKLPLESMHNEESAAASRESASFGPEGDVPRTLRQKDKPQ